MERDVKKLNELAKAIFECNDKDIAELGLDLRVPDWED